MRILITDCDHGFFDPEERGAADRGAELVIAGGPPDVSKALELGADADALLCQYLRVDAELLDALPRCRVVGRYGVGLDNVDVDAARERGIDVVNVPDFCVEEVADHALALALSVTRRVAPLDRAWRADPAGFADSWSERFGLLEGVERSSRQRFGIVGFGRIGRAVAGRAAACGFELAAHDPFLPKEAIEGAAIPLELDDLLTTSDVVSLHLALSTQSEGLLDARRLGLMKPSAVLVNTARGGLIDEGALAEGLRAGRPGWAALDVFSDEPLPLAHELFSLPNAVLTPHVAFYSETSITELKTRAISAVIEAAEQAGARD